MKTRRVNNSSIFFTVRTEAGAAIFGFVHPRGYRQFHSRIFFLAFLDDCFCFQPFCGINGSSMEPFIESAAIFTIFIKECNFRGILISSVFSFSSFSSILLYTGFLNPTEFNCIIKDSSLYPIYHRIIDSIILLCSVSIGKGWKIDSSP